ncbi:phage tail tape measure protein [Paenibacillus dendritiformis]|nr:phage tail tape measure protein [Paenibacillus dendritiformis]
MAEEVYRIEIPVTVDDRSEPALSNVERKVSNFDRTVDRTRQQLDRMNRTKWQLAVHVADRASSVLSAISARIRTFAGKTYRVTVRVLDYATRPLRMIGRMISSTAGMLGVGLTVGAVAFGLGGMIQTAAKFEQSMANVRAVTNASVQEFASLNQRAKELGASMPFTASQVADAMGYLGMAGFTTQQILDGIGPTLLLASAGQMDLAESADIASNVLSGMRMEVSQLERVVDVMARTAATSNTNISQLGGALSYAAPAAADAGVSIEQVSAAIGVLSSSGIQGERAGTAMRMMLLQLNNASSPAAKKLKEMGLNLWDAQGAFKGIIPFMEQVESKGLRLADVANTFGTETAGAASILLNMGSSGFEAYVQQLENAQGAAELMASIQEDTLLGSVRKLSSAWEGISISLGMQAVPAMRAWIDRVTDAVSKGNGLAEVVGGKINNVFAKLLDIMDSDAWNNAGVFGKIKLVWDEIVVKPFNDWWAGGGREQVVAAAEKIGGVMGGTLGSFLMGLFGITSKDVNVEGGAFVEAGSTAGRAFLEAFLEAFDAGKIASKAKDAFLNLQPTWLGGETSSPMGQALALMLDAWLITKVGKLLKGPFKAVRAVTRWARGGAAAETTAVTTAATTRTTATAAETATRTPWYQRWFGGPKGAASTPPIPATTAGPAANLPQGYRPAGTKFWDNIPLDRTYSRDEVVRTANSGQLGRLNDLEKAFGGPTAPKTSWWQKLIPKGGGGRGLGFLSRSVSKLAIPLSVGLDVANIASADAGTERNRAIGGTVGGWGGFAAGAAGGAALGSVVPGLGTAVGGLIGGILGSLGGGAIGDWIGSKGEDISRWFKSTLWPSLKDGANATWTWISDTGPQAIAKGVGFAVGYIGDTLFNGDWWGEKWAAVEAWSNASWERSKETWNNAVAAIESTIFNGEWWAEKWQGVQDWAADTWEGAKDIWNSTREAIGSTLFNGEWWQGKWSAVEGWASNAWENIKGKWSSFWGKVSGAFSEGKEAGQQAASGAKAYARGGFVTTPHIGLVGEAGPEAIIPLSAGKRDRGLDLWERAGRMLGVRPFAFGGIVGSISAPEAPMFAPIAPMAPAGGGLTINVGGIQFSINVEGGDGQSVIDAIREHGDEIADEIAEKIGVRLDESTNNSV